MEDLIVIGGGPGGYHAALTAIKKGLSVTLFEEVDLGGACLHWGCIPSKIYLHNGASTEWSAIRDKTERIRKSFSLGLKNMLSGVNLINERARVSKVSEDYVEISTKTSSFRARWLIVATGATPRIPDIEGIDRVALLTPKEFFQRSPQPDKIAIIGAGPQGIEIAKICASKMIEVTLIEERSTLASLDSEFSRLMESSLPKKIKLYKGISISSIDSSGVKLSNGDEIATQNILLSAGQIAQLPEGLEDFIELYRGAAATDLLCQTSSPRVFAIGDCNGKKPLAHTAYAEAETAVLAITGERREINYSTIPHVIYGEPEYASVGATEPEAIKNGWIVKRKTLAGNGRVAAEQSTPPMRGLCKVVIDGNDQIRGVSLFSPYASEIISMATLLVSKKCTVEDVEKLILPHPTVSEIIRETILED